MIDRLRSYSARKKSIENITSEIERINAEMTRIQSSVKDEPPVSGGENHTEDRLVNLIMAKMEYEAIRAETESWVADMDKAIEELTDGERHIVELLYLHPVPGAYEQLCNDFDICDRATIYRRRNRILRHLTLTFYGVTER